MDLQKEREAFEKAFAQTEFYRNKAGLYSLLADIDDESFDFFRKNGCGDYSIGEAQAAWSAWQAAKAESHKSASLYQLEINLLASANQQLRDYAAKAQAAQEQDQQVWVTSNLTWKDIAFRALSCKVLKSTENWVHVKNIACVGSTTASLICKKLGVDPDGTKFELIEAQEPANDSH